MCGNCVICHEPFVNAQDVDFIEMTPRNALGEMTSGIAVHPWCKEAWYKLQEEENRGEEKC